MPISPGLFGPLLFYLNLQLGVFYMLFRISDSFFLNDFDFRTFE